LFRLAIVYGTLCIGCGHALVSATAPTTCPVPDSVQLEIEASDRVNLDETGRALPTRLRLYQVSDLTRMQSASFEDMWSHAKETLAASSISSDELVIYPGQVAVHRFKRAPAADYIVGVAIFREPEGEGWRTAQEWPAPGDPCKVSNRQMAKLSKLRVRMFLEDSRIESVTNYAEFPKRRCPAGSDSCAASTGQNEAPELRRNRHLRTFEEDPREPESTRRPTESPAH
jgi:type VI secretion system VasD/TssJ family lipoprotein